MNPTTTSVVTPTLPPPRPRAFTDAQALELLKTRIRMGAETNLREFTVGEFDCGTYPKQVTVATMRALMKGRLLPDLTDPETGKVFDYSKVPHSKPGYRAPLDADGNRLPRKKAYNVTKKERLVAEIATELLSRVEQKIVRNHIFTEKHVNDEVGRVFARIAELEAEQCRDKVLHHEVTKALTQRLAVLERHAHYHGPAGPTGCGG